MFKFKKDFSEFSEDLDKYVDSLDLERELKKMNVLPPRIVSSQTIKMNLKLNTHESHNYTFKNDDLLRAV